MADLKDFVKERDAALRSLDKDQLDAYARKYKVPMPKDVRVYWAGIHKARLAVNSMTKEEKEESRQWLKANGFKEEPMP